MKKSSQTCDFFLADLKNLLDEGTGAFRVYMQEHLDSLRFVLTYEAAMKRGCAYARLVSVPSTFLESLAGDEWDVRRNINFVAVSIDDDLEDVRNHFKLDWDEVETVDLVPKTALRMLLHRQRQVLVAKAELERYVQMLFDLLPDDIPCWKDRSIHFKFRRVDGWFDLLEIPEIGIVHFHIGIHHYMKTTGNRNATIEDMLADIEKVRKAWEGHIYVMGRASGNGAYILFSAVPFEEHMAPL